MYDKNTLMKLFTTYLKPQKLILVTEIVFLTPFVYAAHKTTPSKTNTSTPVSAVSFNNKENKPTYVFSTSSHTTTKEFMLETVLIPIEKVKKGVVQSVDKEDRSMILKVGDKLISVQSTASTTFYLGGGDITDESSITSNTRIYVFGYVNTSDTMISALKIIVANRSRLLGL